MDVDGGLPPPDVGPPPPDVDDGGHPGQSDVGDGDPPGPPDAGESQVKKVKVKLPCKILPEVHSSSHGCRHRHFPKYFELEMAKQTRFAMPIYDCKSGREMNDQEVMRIIWRINQKWPVPQVNVVMLGGNSVRCSKLTRDRSLGAD